MKVGLVIYPGCMTSGLFAFSEMLTAANKIAGENKFELVWTGINKNNQNIHIANSPIEISVNINTLISDESLEAVFLPGFWCESVLQLEDMMSHHQNLIEALRKLKPNLSIWTYCTAVSLLAESGQLDNHSATSTWWLAEYLHNKYSCIKWSFNQTHKVSRSFITASGVNGHFQIAQTLIEKHYNKKVWRNIVNLFVLPRPITTVQPFNRIDLMSYENKEIRKIFLWVENTSANNLTLENLSNYMFQTKRTLSRKIKLETGISSIHFLRLIKLKHVGELLIYTNKTISTIASDLGYSDDMALRRSFKKESQLTPSEFRKIFKR